ncbi:MAG TPA: ABC transporter substrate-binding protein, partial [Gemmatimonadaceae bacterium]|nr:ABC transporter substrate-binding protein [Gemmatimonadaceae bacterium]
MHNVKLRGRRAASIVSLALTACSAPAADVQTVVYASGADLESANPFVTIHPLSRQVQRFALFTTIAQYDSLLHPRPYLARAWTWSADRRELFLALHADVRWHDGSATTAGDVRFTLEAARDPTTGYYRAADLAGITSISVPNDTTVIVRFANPQPELPAVFCELPIAPAHRLANVVRSALKADTFGTSPVGNGPFRFLRHDAGQRWVFDRNPDFPASMGGPPTLERMVVAVV